MPIGNTSTISRIDRAEHRAPVFGGAGERILQPGECGGAEERPGERVEPAQQHHHQRIDRARNRERFRRNAAFGKCVQAAGQSRESAGERESAHCIARAHRCRSLRRAAANRGSPRSA